MFEPLKLASIWPLEVSGKKFLYKVIPHIGNARASAQHDKSEDREATGTQQLLDHGGIERDLQKQGLIDEQSETVPVPLTFVSFYNVLLSFFYLLCTLTL